MAITGTVGAGNTAPSGNVVADDDLIAAARDMPQTPQWHQYLAEHPDIAEAAQPKPKLDHGIGSDEKRLAPGICWRGADKDRRYRATGTLVDDDDLEDQCSIDTETKNTKPHLLGRCAVCGKPLPSGWPEMECEFPPAVAGCRCGGCNPRPKASKGRRRYCEGECQRQMNNALRRADRASQGKSLRRSEVDPIVYARAQYKVGLRDRARQSKSEVAEHPPLWCSSQSGLT